MTDSGSPHSEADDSIPGTGSAQGTVAGVTATVGRVFSDFLDLLALELRLAGLSLVQMVALGVVSALLAAGAWTAIAAGAVVWLYAHGISLAPALLLVGAISGVLALLSILWALRLSRRLGFPATRRVLSLEPLDDQPQTQGRSEGTKSAGR